VSPSEIRRDAREALKGKWGKAVCIVLAFLAVSMLMGFVQGFINEESIVYTILEVAYVIINVPFSFGLIISFMKIKRNEEVKTLDFIKDGFLRFGKSWGITWHTFIRLLLPVVCLILVVILHLVLFFTGVAVQLGTLFSLLYIVLLFTTIIYIACRALLYVLAYYISFDNPELSSKECVKKSEELMKGHRGNYFMLELSFIGWSLLAVLTLGIGMLWLTPYMQVAVVCFYEKIISKKETEKAEK